MKYIVITLDDAKRIARFLRGAPLNKEPVIVPRCEAWKSGPLWCALPEGHDGDHDFSEGPAVVACESAVRIADRMAQETGADMQEIVDILKGQELCSACEIEGVADSCGVHMMHKQGRRLRRLLERARGERGKPT